MLRTPGRRPGAGLGEGQTKEQPMQGIRNVWRRIAGDEGGQGLAEYALILALIAIVAIVALVFLGGEISKILGEVGKSV
jgi:pilus assembly protein Flp/PilA